MCTANREAAPLLDYFTEAAGAKEEVAPVAPEPVAVTAATILLVEDQEGLRLLGEEVLISAGYKVLSAANGRAALKLLEDHPDRIDLLITDVVMPEMNGPQLAEQLLRLRPSLIVLFVSGYSGDALLHRGTIENGTAFLQKPFLPSALRGKVAELLGNPEQPQA